MSASGFAVWVTGPEPDTVQAVADEIGRRLAGRDVPVEWLDARTPGIDALAGAAGVALAAALLARHGIASVVAVQATRAERERARAHIGNLVEVHVLPTPGRAAAAYEPPARAEVEIPVPETSPAAGAERVLRTLEVLNLLSATDRAYSEEEEREVIRRLKAFGYL